MRLQKGNAALFVILIVAAGIGAVAVSPDIAQQVLPGQALVMLPQFEAVDTGANCTQIEKGTATVNQWVPKALLGGQELQPSQVKNKICDVKCNQYQSMAATYCSSDMLSCACRTAQ